MRKNSILLITSLITLSALLIPSKTYVEKKGSFEEDTIDVCENEFGLDLTKGLKIGDTDTVSVSPTYAQTGTYVENGVTYNVLRFATAVRGNIESISYLRGMVDGKIDAPLKEVSTIYKSIKAGDDLYYYNGTELTTDESAAGEYFWACYTIKYTSDDFKFHAIPVTINVNNKFYEEKVASLGLLNNEEHTHTFNVKSTRDCFKNTSSQYYTSCVCGEKGEELFTAYDVSLSGGATFNDGKTSRKYGSNALVGGIIVPKKEGYHFNGFVNVNEITSYSSTRGTTFTMPSENVAIQPHYEVDEFGSNLSVKGGKVNLKHNGTTINKINGFTSNPSLREGAIRVSKEEAETATVYETKQAPKDGYWFNSMAPFTVASSQKIKITYTIQNQGPDKIAFNVHQINGSSIPQTPSELLKDNIASRNVVLNVGEYSRFTLEMTGLGNSNILTNYNFIGSHKEFVRIAVTQYVELQDENAKTSRVTIQNLSDSNFSVKFKDNTTTRSFKVGNSIQNTLVTAPNGYCLAGWIDANDNSKFYRVSNFVIGEEDVTLIPYFEKDTYLDLGVFGNTPPIHTKISGFSNTKLKNQLTQEPVLIGEGNDAHYEIATSFNYDVAPQKGWYFISMIPSTSISGTKYKLTFKMTNNGLDTLNIEMWHTSSSSNPKASGNGNTTVTIEPNQTVVATIEYSNISNNNMMTYYEFTSSLSNPLALQVIEYFELA